MTRLLTEDWSEMTSAARAADKHPSNLSRWEDIARAENPALTDEQAARLALMLRRQHYQRLGKLSGEARRIAARAAEELARADEGA